MKIKIRTTFLVYFLLCFTFLTKAENKKEKLDKGQDQYATICASIKKGDTQIPNDSFFYFSEKYLGKLFDRSAYIKNSSNAEVLNQAWLFTITEKDLKLIENSKDPWQWEILMKVFENAKSFSLNDEIHNQKTSVNYALERIILGDPMVFYGLDAFAAIIFISVISIKMYTKQRIILLLGMFLAAFLFTILIYGYFKRYNQCNTELKLAIVKYKIKKNHFEDPCEGLDVDKIATRIKKKSFWSQPSKSEECIEHLEFLEMEARKIDLSTDRCSPEKVLFQYVSDILASPWKIFIDVTWGKVDQIMAEYWFPKNIVLATLYLIALLLGFAIIVIGIPLSLGIGIKFKLFGDKKYAEVEVSPKNRTPTHDITANKRLAYLGKGEKLGD